jgi:long-chain acyl-CoA synthetase
MYEKKPWLKFYGDIPRSLDYPERTMYGMVREAAGRFPEYTAYDFMGTRRAYAGLIADIDRMADALVSRGLKKGDTVTISLPNCPQALIMFYALNKIGAVASMIHPLSASTEIEFYLKESRSIWAVTLDAFYKNFAPVLDNTKVTTLLLARIGDYLSPLKRAGFFLASGRKIKKPPADDKRVIWWNSLIGRPNTGAAAARASKHTAGPIAGITAGHPPRPAAGRPEKTVAALTPHECAVILYSGGTTGTPKGIMLSSHNFNCLGMQIGTQGPIQAGDVILSILPVFHGFGLGVCVHTFLIAGGKCILVPRFTPETVAALIKKEKPQYMAGVPTLYEALASNRIMRTADLACLKTAYAGGDRLPHGIKERFDALIKACGGDAELLEGYGLTESVTACIVTPRHGYREGSVGIPLPDMWAKITAPAKEKELPPGTEGELCVSGPTLMLGYLNSKEITAQTLRKHADGRVWLHTGDICSMDTDGFVYFKLRMKRIIKVSGVSVSPVQVEEVLDRHPDVSLSCVIGIPDPYKMQTVKAFTVLKDHTQASPEKEKELIDYCRKHLIKWSVPEQIEFRPSLPLTLVGKVAFSELEKEHARASQKPVD